MRRFFLILIIITFCHAELVSASDQQSSDDKTLKQVQGDGLIYTHVPRGTIISVPEGDVFKDDKIRQSALPVLDKVADAINAAGQNCTIECHGGDWETSMARAASVFKYLTGKVPQKKLSMSAFGDWMPEPALPAGRLDFVITDYAK